MKDSTILGVTKSPNIAAIGTRADFADLACIRWTKSQIIILERYNDKVSRSPDAGQGFGNVDCGLRIAALLSSPVGSIIKGCPLRSPSEPWSLLKQEKKCLGWNVPYFYSQQSPFRYLVNRQKRP